MRVDDGVCEGEGVGEGGGEGEGEGEGERESEGEGAEAECRLCLGRGAGAGRGAALYGGGEQDALRGLITECTGLQLACRPQAGLPGRVCGACVCSLHRHHAFRTRALRVDTELRQRLLDRPDPSVDPEPQGKREQEDYVDYVGDTVDPSNTESALSEDDDIRLVEYASKVPTSERKKRKSKAEKRKKPDKNIKKQSGQTGSGKKICETCGKIISSSSALTVHMRKHTGERPYTCAECERGFTHPGSLREHTIRVHLKTRNIICDECGKTFVTRRDLQLHIRSHTGEKPFKCNQCDKGFQQKNAFTVHMRYHTGEKPYECGICKKKFTSNVYLKSHQTLHPEFWSTKVKNKKSEAKLKNQTCDICGKISVSPSALMIHKRTHSGEKPLACTECDKKFKHPGSLREHMLRLHLNERSVICEECGKGFISQRDLQIHLRSHTGEKPFQCTECKKRFQQKNALIEHMRSHTGDLPFVCNLCPKKFRSKLYLKSHLTTHSNDRPHKCDVCDMAFKTQKALYSHELYHRGQRKKFACDKCKSTFTIRRQLLSHLARIHSPRSGVCQQCDKFYSDLSSHMKWHRGESPHVCTDCGRKFSRASGLTQHCIAHHMSKDAILHCPIEGCTRTFTIQKKMEYHVQRQHLTEKPHVCPKCAKGFFRLSDMTRHQKACSQETDPDQLIYLCMDCSTEFSSVSDLNKHHVNCPIEVKKNYNNLQT